MPLYDFRCQLCGALVDYHCKIADRFDKIDCPTCGKTDCCERTVGVSVPNFGTERRVGRDKLIYSEKQVAQEYGKRWRDKGTTGKEGGAGKKQYHHS